MPRAVTCLLNKIEVSIADALRLRDSATSKRDARFDFRCIDCGNPVKPHKEGKYGAHTSSTLSEIQLASSAILLEIRSTAFSVETL